MLRGILIVATDKPFYGRMAYNLAVTIKAVDKNFPVAVLWNGMAMSHLSRRQLDIFDQIIEIKESAFCAKVHLYENTPFKETLYLDADTAWLPYKSPTELFDSLKGVDFTGITEGWYDLDSGEDKSSAMYHFWCAPNEAKEVYKLTGRMYQWRSEVLFFRKGAVAKKVFSLAKKVWTKPMVAAKMFAGHVPDELSFNIAACKLGIRPHEDFWRPSYWHRLHGEGGSLGEIARRHYILSAGGNFASSAMKTSYNNVCMAAHRKLGLQYLFTLQSKRAVMTDRIKM